MKKNNFICFFVVFVLIGYFSFFNIETRKNMVVVKRNDKLMSAATDAGFNDENFYSCVLEAAGKTAGTVLTDEELQGITNLSCINKNISDVRGLEKMSNLEVVSFAENALERIDLSNNLKLIEISLNKNNLKNIDFSKNSELEKIVVSANPNLEKLDVSYNTKLKHLYASSCKLDNGDLILGNISGLKSLNLYQNNFSELDISKNAGLVDLNLSLNDLDENDINFNEFPILKRIYASGNLFKNVDLSSNPELTDANFYSNYDKNGKGLSSINVNGCTKLQYLLVSLNHLNELKLDSNTELRHLYASGNNISSIDLSNNKKLYDINLYSNKLENIKLPETATLQILKLSVNKLNSLDVSKNLNLKKLYVSSNNLKKLDLSKNLELESANIAFNKFESPVTFAASNKISYLWLDESDLSSYDLKKLSNLNDLGTVYSKTIPVYGDTFMIDEIQEYLPSNIKVNKYKLYDTFNGMPDKHKIYDDFVDNPSEEFSDVIGGESSAEINLDKGIKGKGGETYKLQVLAEGATNNNISSYTGKYSYNGFYTLQFGNISSSKYVIDEDNSIIDVGGDSDDVIKSNIKNSLSGSVLEINGDKLSLKYNGNVIRDFTLQRVDAEKIKTGSLTLYLVIGIMIIGVISIFISKNVTLKNKI